jgi:hypothetical protein
MSEENVQLIRRAIPEIVAHDRDGSARLHFR